MHRAAAAQLARAAACGTAPSAARLLATSAAPPAASGRSAFAAGAAAASFLFACAAAATTAPPTHALRSDEAPPTTNAAPSSAPSAAQLEALHAWLRARCAAVDKISIAPSASDTAAGLGVHVSAGGGGSGAWLPRFLRPAYWLGWPGRTLAEFPLSNVISARNATCEPSVGALYDRWWKARLHVVTIASRRLCCAEPSRAAVSLQEGELSDREVVLLFLIVVRRAAASLTMWCVAAALTRHARNAGARARRVLALGALPGSAASVAAHAAVLE